MPTLFRSMLFALLASVSVLANAAPVAPTSSAMVQASASGKVNLNQADANTLQQELSGIGAAKALAIVAHREQHGVFTSVDELLEVKGIGKSLVDKNRDKLTLE